jgi:hypothetical protein
MAFDVAEDYARNGSYSWQENDSIFQPDSVMPGQFAGLFRSTQYRSPEARLVIAVLEDAIRTFFRYRSWRNRKERRLFNDVEAWFFTPSQDGVFSFENVCVILRVNASYIRRGLLAVQTTVQRQRPIERFYRAAAASKSRIVPPRLASLKDRGRRRDRLTSAKRRSLGENQLMRKSLRSNGQNVVEPTFSTNGGSALLSHNRNGMGGLRRADT